MNIIKGLPPQEFIVLFVLMNYKSKQTNLHQKLKGEAKEILSNQTNNKGWFPKKLIEESMSAENKFKDYLSIPKGRRLSNICKKLVEERNVLQAEDLHYVPIRLNDPQTSQKVFRLGNKKEHIKNILFEILIRNNEKLLSEFWKSDYFKDNKRKIRRVIIEFIKSLVSTDESFGDSPYYMLDYMSDGYESLSDGEGNILDIEKKLEPAIFSKEALFKYRHLFFKYHIEPNFFKNRMYKILSLLHKHKFSNEEINTLFQKLTLMDILFDKETTKYLDILEEIVTYYRLIPKKEVMG
jgi:hypothetical protein